MLALLSMGLLIRHHHGSPMWPVLCGPLLVAGAGSGLVIGPNLTLALQRVPPAQGGTAAAILRTGQRIGSAFGLAVVGSSFLGTLGASHGDSALAARRGVLTSAALIGAALLAAVADVLASARARRKSRLVPRSADGPSLARER